MAWGKHGKFVKVRICQGKSMSIVLRICQGTVGRDKNSVLTIIKGIARGYYLKDRE